MKVKNYNEKQIKMQSIIPRRKDQRLLLKMLILLLKILVAINRRKGMILTISKI